MTITWHLDIYAFEDNYLVCWGRNSGGSEIGKIDELEGPIEETIPKIFQHLLDKWMPGKDFAIFDQEEGGA